MEALIYLANALHLLSYLMRDILHLRILIITAMLCMLPYHLGRPEPVMEIVYWNLFFIAMNLWLIGRTLRQRQRNMG